MMTSPPARYGARLEALVAAAGRAGPASSAGPSVDDLLHPGAVLDAEVEALGELRVDGGGRDAEVGVADLAVAAQLVERAAAPGRPGSRSRRPRRRRCVVRICALMPSTSPSRVEQRAAGVAVVDRGVGLDRAERVEAGERLDRAVESPRRRRPTATAPRRTGCRSRRPARRRSASPRRAERQRAQRQAARARCLQQRDVGVRVEADDLRRRPGCRRRTGRRPRRPCAIAAPSPLRDDVRVRRDLAARRRRRSPSPGRRCRLAAAERRRSAASKTLTIVTTPGAVAPVDRRGVEAAARAPARSTTSTRVVRSTVVGRRVARRSSPSPSPPQPRRERSRGGERGERARARASRRQLERERRAPGGRLDGAAGRPCARPARGRSRGRGPEPWASSEVKNGSKMRSSAWRLMPVAEVAHRRGGRGRPARAAVTTMSVPGGRVRERVVDEDTHDLGDPLRVAHRPRPALRARRSSRCESCARERRARTRSATARASIAEVGRLGAQLERAGLELARGRAGRWRACCSRSTCSRTWREERRARLVVEVLVLRAARGSRRARRSACAARARRWR